MKKFLRTSTVVFLLALLLTPTVSANSHDIKLEGEDGIGANGERYIRTRSNASKGKTGLIKKAAADIVTGK